MIAATEQSNDTQTPPIRPAVGQTVIYYPADGEGLAGGWRGFPAIVVSVDGVAPDFGLTLAVIGMDARMVARSRPPSRETWEASGSDPAVAHWSYTTDAG